MACAGTIVEPIASQAPKASLRPPRTIAVIVENDSPVPERASRREEHLADDQKAVAVLSESISALLALRQLAAAGAMANFGQDGLNTEQDRNSTERIRRNHDSMKFSL
jgi:hypothetical protein